MIPYPIEKRLVHANYWVDFSLNQQNHLSWLYNGFSQNQVENNRTKEQCIGAYQCQEWSLLSEPNLT